MIDVEIQALVDAQYPALPSLRATARPAEEIDAVADGLREHVHNLFVQLIAAGEAVNTEALAALHHELRSLERKYGDAVRQVLAYHLVSGSTVNSGICHYYDLPAPDNILGSNGILATLIEARSEKFGVPVFEVLDQLHQVSRSTFDQATL